MKTVKIGEVCNISSAGDKPKTFSITQTNACNVPVYGNGRDNEGLVGYTDKALISNEAITISARGSSCGATFYHDEPYTPIVRLLSLTPNKDKVSAKYLYYQVKNRGFKSTGSGQPQITIPQIADCKIEIEEDIIKQEKIADILFSIDLKITNNNKIIKASEELIREIYEYWFIQFDFPNENNQPYKSSGGEMVYDEKLKRKIPKGWKTQNLLKNDLCKDIKPGIDKFNNTKTYYATADVVDNEMGIGTQIDYENRESRANMQPKPNSVWFAKMKKSIKHITVIPTSDDLLERSVFSTGFFGLKCEPETLSYIRGFIYSDYFEKVKDLNSSGATMEAISNDGVKNIKLLIPDKEILKKYSNITSAHLTQNDILRKENAKLISLRDWLLPMLMSGQIKVSD